MTNEEKGPENVAAQTYVLLDPRDFDLGDPRILPLIPKEVYRKAILNRIKPLGEVSGIQIEDLDVRGKLQGYGQVAHISLTPIGSIGSLCDPDRRSRNRDLEEKDQAGSHGFERPARTRLCQVPSAPDHPIDRWIRISGNRDVFSTTQTQETTMSSLGRLQYRAAARYRTKKD